MSELDETFDSSECVDESTEYVDPFSPDALSKAIFGSKYAYTTPVASTNSNYTTTGYTTTTGALSAGNGLVSNSGYLGQMYPAATGWTPQCGPCVAMANDDVRVLDAVTVIDGTAMCQRCAKHHLNIIIED